MMMLAYAAVALCAVAGARYTASGARSAWYARVRPAHAPPRAVFASVWLVMYASLAHALSAEAAGGNAVSVAAQGGQLLLTGWWCRVFFGERRPAAAAVVLAGIVLLSALALATARTPAVRVVYGGLYLPWCLYALSLNLASVSRADTD